MRSPWKQTCVASIYNVQVHFCTVPHYKTSVVRVAGLLLRGALNYSSFVCMHELYAFLLRGH